jgi:hypothetical protein
MRLALPIGAPGAPGPINRQLLANTSSYALSGGAAQLIYTQSTGLIDPRTLNATNTGAVLGGTFTNANPGTITAPGTYTNQRYTGVVTIKPSTANLNAFYLFRNCYFAGTNDDFNQVLIPDGGSNPAIPTNIHFEYCTFDDGGTGMVNGLTGAFKTATRCYFKGFDNCLQLYDPCTITECANDGVMRLNRNGDSHWDCVENNGVPNVLIQSCKWINNQDQTSAIQLNNFGGSCSNNTIDNCYLEGGGYTCYADNSFNTGPGFAMTNIRFTRNIIKSGFWGPASFYTSDVYFPTTGADKNTLI